MARKTGIIAGIIALMLAFIYKFPLFPPEGLELYFTIFTHQGVEYYFWGYINRAGQASSSIILQSPENLVALAVWLIIFTIGLISIMASTTKAKITNSLKLYRINLVFIILLLFIYAWNILILNLNNFPSIFYPIFEILGLGYYLLIVILILNILALKKLKKVIPE